MQILDEDMQMIRDFLATADAPEFVKGHFENLVSEHAKELAEVADLRSELDDVSDYDDLKRDVARLQEEVDERDADQVGALETVKYWLIDFLHHKRTTKTPQHVLRIVEDVL
jgi:hypothetical protein